MDEKGFVRTYALCQFDGLLDGQMFCVTLVPQRIQHEYIQTTE